ncbi:MAG: glycerate 2-kinase [Chthoniobacter sp.]|jgi:glycerate kinase|nr:glycerate 2-kinase [Chthoniobacter sp.]
MRILVAPDKFKGSISAVAAAEAIARGWRKACPEAQLELAPIADGGEGFAEALGQALGGEWITVPALDPIGREVSARYAWIAERKLAIIEMSEASGLWRLKPEERDPLRASTYGTGQLMRDAAGRGARTILVGLGGSATTDGGIGMAAALGYETLTSDGDELDPIPRNLPSLTRIVGENVIGLPEVIAACDVQNPLLGARGAARVFSPQKGADPMTVEALEVGLEALAEVVATDLGCDFRNHPGAGAAGGIGFGLMSFCGASMRPGFDIVAEALRLEERIAASDLVITGEGRLDDQTLDGKGPSGVASLAHRHGKRVIAFAGSVLGGDALSEVFDAICPLVDQPVALEAAMNCGAEFLERAAYRTARLFQLGQSHPAPRAILSPYTQP